VDDKDQAIESLQQEYTDHSTGMTSLKSNPEYDSLRSDPRFVDLMPAFTWPQNKVRQDSRDYHRRSNCAQIALRIRCALIRRPYV
jgi:hypothetical protein